MTNNIDDAWEPLTQWLRCNGRQAFNTETGGGNTASCVTYLCQQIAYQAQNSDGMYTSPSTAVDTIFQQSSSDTLAGRQETSIRHMYSYVTLTSPSRAKTHRVRGTGRNSDKHRVNMDGHSARAELPCSKFRVAVGEMIPTDLVVVAVRKIATMMYIATDAHAS